MKKIFIAALLLAMFVALTGGYGQVINSDWVSRSFTSAVEEVNDYPVLEVGKGYSFYFLGASTDLYDGDGSHAVTVQQQNGRWVLIRKVLGDKDLKWVNLDGVAFISYSSSEKE